jgi:ribosome biogenesis GTPase
MRIEAVNGVGIDAVRARMLDKISLVSGHSGVGKTTLINQLVPGLNLKTAEVSDSHNKGKHTTTFAEMHKLPEGGWIIDTPGVKGFGLVDIPKEELHHHFPEIFRLLADCKFHNCLHLNEPGCAVREAVEKTELPEERYRNYLAMYHEDDGPYRS